MRDLDQLKQELDEYRLSRPSDISGNTKLSGNDLRSLMGKIKRRVTKGEQRKRIVKDELVKFWKKKGMATRQKILKTFKEEKLDEGGNMFPAATQIHISEVSPTLQYLAQIIKLNDIEKYTLGSTGKKEFSGDLDIAVPYTSTEEIDSMFEMLQRKLGDEAVRKQGKMISILLPIQNFDKTKGEDRTGQVQTDLIFTEDPDWYKFYYHSSGASKLKGMHRNAAISALASQLERKESSQTDELGRPRWTERWKWSPIHGLMKIKRLSYRNERTGKTVKKQKDVMLGEPTKNPKEIANVLFDGQATPDDLDSLESIVAAVKRVYNPADADTIFHAMGTDIARSHARQHIQPGEYEFPPELSKHMDTENT